MRIQTLCLLLVLAVACFEFSESKVAKNGKKGGHALLIKALQPHQQAGQKHENEVPHQLEVQEKPKAKKQGKTQEQNVKETKAKNKQTPEKPVADTKENRNPKQHNKAKTIKNNTKHQEPVQGPKAEVQEVVKPKQKQTVEQRKEEAENWFRKVINWSTQLL